MKKTLSFILVLAMVATMFAAITVPASAAEATTIASDKWDGTVDTSWFNEADIKTEYTLTTAEQLAGLAQIVNTNATMDKPFDGVTIKLGADIIWNDGIFTTNELGAPLYNGKTVIGNAENPVNVWPVIGTMPKANNTNKPTKTHFHGNIDGQGHVISGLYAFNEGSYTSFISVFGGNYIKNLSIINSYFGCETRTGAFAGFVSNADTKDVEFENLYTNAFIQLYKTDGNARSAGFFGMMRHVNNVSMKNLWFNGTVNALCSVETANSSFIGGLVGVICEENDGETIVMDSCLITGTINAFIGADAQNAPQAGLIGNIYSNNKSITLNVKNCLVAPEAFAVKGTPGEKTPVSAFVARFEKSFAVYTIENSYLVAVGSLKNGDVVSSIAGVETEGAHTAGLKFNGAIVAEAGTFVAADAATKVEDPAKATGLSADTFALTATSAAIKGLRTCLAECVYGELIAETPASCEGDGMKAHYECQLCGKLYDDKKVATTEADLVIPASHEYGELKAAVAPTLDAAGVLEHYECSVCHKYFDKDKNEIASIEGEPKLTTKAPETTKAPTTTVADEAPATTAAPAEKSCGGFAAIGAVLALVAVTGAAIVIKKK